MATTKNTKNTKTTTKTAKPSTDELVNEITSSVEEIQEETIAVKEEVASVVKEEATKVKIEDKKAPKKFAPDEQIECRSITYGELILPGKKSQLIYSWANYGDIAYVEYQDLQALRSTKSQYLNAPLFLIEDEELLEQWPEFKALYGKIASVDIDSFFDLPINKFVNAIKNIPNGFKESIKNAASAKILDGTLDSIVKIKSIDEALGTDLMFYIQ